jgi:hypothetical protein
MGQGLDGTEGLSHRSNSWKFKKKIELMYHTHIINTGLKGIFPVIRGTYIKPLCPIQPLSHPTPLSPVMYQGKARKSMGGNNLVSPTVINFNQSEGKLSF